MTENIYIKSYEFGYKNLSTGIAYNELINYLDAQGLKPTGDFEKYFHSWFYFNFYAPFIYIQLRSLRNAYVADETNLLPHDNVKAILTGEAQKEYLSYLTLQQAKKDASNALKLSRIAIYISIGVAFVQIVLQIIDMVMDKNSFCLWRAF